MKKIKKVNTASSLAYKLVDRATMGAGDRAAIQELGDEFAMAGVALSINGGNALLACENFAATGSKDSIVNLSVLRRASLLALAADENKNKYFFMVNAEEGVVDVGFRIDGIFDGVPEDQAINFRFPIHIDDMPSILDGPEFEKTWVDEVTIEQYSTIVDVESLRAVAYDILSGKVLRMQLAGEI